MVISITEVYDKYYEQVYADLLLEFSTGKKRQRLTVPNPAKSKMIISLIAKIYDIPIDKLTKVPEIYLTDDWVKEARGLLYYLHFQNLFWKKKLVFGKFGTNYDKMRKCMDSFIMKKDNQESTKEKYNYLVKKLNEIEI